MRPVAAASGVVLVAGTATLAATGRIDIHLLLGLSAAVQFAVAASYLIYLRRATSWFPPKLDLALTRGLITAGLKVHLGTVSTLLYVRVDQILVYNLGGREETGFYAIAVAIAMQVMLVPLAVQQVLYSRLIGQEDADAAKLSIRVTRITLGACIDGDE
jgi:O-antigen/teichoic acid export membrane protein